MRLSMSLFWKVYLTILGSLAAVAITVALAAYLGAGEEGDWGPNGASAYSWPCSRPRTAPPNSPRRSTGSRRGRAPTSPSSPPTGPGLPPSVHRSPPK